MIHQLDIEGRDKVDKAVMRLQAYEPPEGYYLCFSGGKDSVVIKALADMAGVKYDAHYNVTSVDPPELVRFIKKCYPDVAWDFPRDKEGNRISMWTLIPKKKMPPTRIARYCCAVLKERGGKGRLKITGVRWAESSRRKKLHGEVTIIVDKKLKEIAEQEYSHIAYKVTPQGGIALPLDNRENAQMVEQCYRTRSTTVNPIIDWTDEEVWEFIHEYKVPYCELYDQGYERLGCIGCPMAGAKRQKQEFRHYPKYYNLYIKAFDNLVKVLNDKKRCEWKNGQDVMDWWLNDDRVTETEITELVDDH